MQRNSLIVGLVVGLVLGILLGMVLFWYVWPVEWTDAYSYHLAPAAKADYMVLVAESFNMHKDRASAEAYLEGWTDEEIQESIIAAKQEAEGAGQADTVQALDDLAMVLGLSATVPPEEPAAPPEEAAPPGLWERIRGICFVFVIVLLILVLGWIGYRQAMKRRQAAPPPIARPEPAAVVAPPEDEWEGIGQPPLGHFFTTYELGEDTYDESFSIETPMGEFLGECGVGISETIGVGDPDKVTAFEVWLFDKSDIRTVTKVLMSDYAFRDDALRAKLASKGEAVLAQPGDPVILETTSLQVRVDVTELDYGEGDVPPNSFFQRLTVELVATTKTGDMDADIA
ncbi:MAG: hypothetical protein PVI09_12430 [Anaerolineae bacterium]|jgi:hypothetical protein